MTRAEQMIADLKTTSGLIPPTTLDPYAPKPKRDTLLVTREATHGKFSDTARIAQELKSVIVTAPGYTKLNNAQREVLDMLATKIGRILSGNPLESDHWDDIAGYGKLGSEACS
jgi:hypothetical protein